MRTSIEEEMSDEKEPSINVPGAVVETGLSYNGKRVFTSTAVPDGHVYALKGDEKEHPGRWPVSVDWADPEATIIDPSYGVPLAKEERERLQQARDYILQVERERDHFYTYNKANHEELERVFDEKEKFVQEIAELKAREVELEKSAKFTNAVMEDVNEELEK
jgi:hypothetical protein